MKFLVIGLGSIGLRHAKNLLAMGHEVWGFDLDDAAEDKAEEAGVVIGFWDGDNIDAYVICTPTATHYEEMCGAIRAGKHVFVEKPIAHYAQIRQGGLPELLEEAKRKNLVVMVGNMLRFHPNVRLAKFMIKKPTKAIFQVLQKNERYKDSVILNWGAHEIDIALYLFGPANVQDAIGTHNRATVTLEHDNGVMSIINMDYLTEPEVRRFDVDDGDITHNIDLTLHDWNDIYIKEMKEFIERVELANTPDTLYEATWAGATGDDGLATLELIDAAERMAVTR